MTRLEEITDVGNDLNDDSKEFLLSEIDMLKERLEKQREFDCQPRLSRKERNRKLEALSKRLDGLDGLINELVANGDPSLNTIYADRLARLLSHDGVNAVLGLKAPLPGSSSRFLDSREATGRLGPAAALEQLQLEHRDNALKNAGPQALSGLIGQLKVPLDIFLEGERENSKGGAPQRLNRNIAVHELAIVYEDVFNEPATTTLGGTFMLLCADVLRYIGEDSAGLESAVHKVLKTKRR